MPQLKKWLLLCAGILCVMLGVVGVFLPGLPTTPFILLAAACFARSSPAMHQRLLDNRLFGPLLADWESHHSIPLGIKWLSTGLMLLAVGISATYFDATALRVLIVSLGLVGCWVVWRIPTRRRPLLDN